MSALPLGVAVLLAVFVIVTTSVSLVVALLLPCLEPRLSRLAPGSRATLLLGLGLLPAGAGAGAAFALALPAWLRHEPAGIDETPGAALLLLAAAGSLLVVGRLASALRDAVRTARLVGRWLAEGRTIEGLPFAATRVPDDFPAVALAGVARPRLFVSDAALRALTRPELEAVVEHERAHAAANENLRRLLLRASPDLLALLPAGRRLRRRFEEAAEAAADRAACARVEPLLLAKALLKVARLVPSRPPVELQAAMLLREGGVAARVRALLAASASLERDTTGAAPLSVGRLGVALFVAAASLAALLGDALPRLHALLEALVHLA